jgi:hypothetical protein
MDSIKVCPGIDSVITITGDGGQKINICTLTREQSLNFWKFKLWGMSEPSFQMPA